MNRKIGLIIVSAVAAVSIVGVASAQDATQTPPSDTTQTLVRPFRLLQDGAQPLMGELLQIVADDLNLEPQDVLQQLRGQTLADVITGQNGDLAKITADVVAAVTDHVNQAVANGNLTQERADQILANLADNIEMALNGELRGGLIDRFGAGRQGMGGQRPGLGGQRNGMGGQGQLGQVRPNLMNRDVSPLLSSVQDALGLTRQQLAQELAGGSTLGEVIATHNGDSAAIIDAAVAKAAEHLDAVRADGTLTQAQEDAMLSGLRAFYEAVLNGAFHPQADQAAPDGSV